MMQQRLFENLSADYPTQRAHGLYIRDVSGALVPARDSEILAAARKIVDQTLPRGETLNCPQVVRNFFAMKMNNSLEHEVFGMVLLNAAHEVIEYLEPFRGTLTQASVYPREVVKIALKANAAAVIIGHNHPSGRLEPSAADEALTKHLHKALQLIDVRLLDHILVANHNTLSFAERGYL